uniref:Non-selective voltage-gated ion channel VDAC3 n=1 Tax=Paramormyrops kingsleyae TaxID=1676925 RepID=A0A3B3TEB7_9TELE
WRYGHCTLLCSILVYVRNVTHCTVLVFSSPPYSISPPGFGLVKLDLKTKSESGVEFITSGSSSVDTGKATGNLETKYKLPDLGLSFSQKWNTDNTLTSEVTLEDQLAQGLKLTFDTSFVPNTGKKSGKLKAGYKREYVNLGCDVDFDFAGPTVHAATVLGYEGWLVGYQMAFDTAKSKLVQNNFALGYKAGDFQLHTNVNEGTEFGGSIYQKVNDKLETAVSLAWTAGSNNTRFGIAGKYQLDQDTSLSVSVFQIREPQCTLGNVFNAACVPKSYTFKPWLADAFILRFIMWIYEYILYNVLFTTPYRPKLTTQV